MCMFPWDCHFIFMINTLSEVFLRRKTPAVFLLLITYNSSILWPINHYERIELLILKIFPFCAAHRNSEIQYRYHQAPGLWLYQQLYQCYHAENGKIERMQVNLFTRVICRKCTSRGLGNHMSCTCLYRNYLMFRSNALSWNHIILCTALMTSPHVSWDSVEQLGLLIMISVVHC